MKKIIIPLIFLLSISLLNGQINSDYFKPNLKLPSLINPNKISMHHSISFMSGIDSFKNGYYQSSYTNHLKYNFNSKLSMSLDLSMVNLGLTNFQDNFQFQSNSNNTMFVPSFSLNYKPTENMFISFEFRKSSPFKLMNQNDGFWYR